MNGQLTSQNGMAQTPPDLFAIPTGQALWGYNLAGQLCAHDHAKKNFQFQKSILLSFLTNKWFSQELLL